MSGLKNCTRILLVCLLLQPGLKVWGQQHSFDSLQQIYSKPGFKPDTAFLNRMNDFNLHFARMGLPGQIKFCQKGLEFAKQIGYPKGLARAYFNLGSVMAFPNHDAAALPFFEKAVRLFRLLKDEKSLVEAYSNLGMFYGEIQDFKSEMSFYAQALEALEKTKDSECSGALIQGNIGTSYEDRKKYDSAMHFYRAMLSSSAACGNADYQMWANLDLSSLYLKLGRPGQGLEYARRALEVVNQRHVDDYLGKIDINLQTGLSLIKLGRPGEAAPFINQAISQARRAGEMERLSAGLRIRFSLDSVFNNNVLAGRDISEYAHEHDSLQTSRYSAIVALYQTKFDIDRKKMEHDVLRSKEGKNKALIASLRLLLLILAGCFLLIIIFFFSLRRRHAESNRLASLNNQLFAIISHDLRVPFTQIKGLLSLSEQGDLSTAEFHDFVPQIREQTDSTLALLDNLLIWSKNQMKGFIPKKERIQVLGLVKENVMQLQGNLNFKNLQVELQVDPGLYCLADREMTHIVVRNLLSNAIKFSQAGATIEIKAEKTAQLTLIAIKDQGSGITADDRAKLFTNTNFSRPGTAGEKGTGMGLKLCRDLLVLNGGDISLHTETGRGSTFSFTLPGG